MYFFICTSIIGGPIAMLSCVSLNYFTNCDKCNKKAFKIKSIFEQVHYQTLKILNSSTLESMRE
jgi:DNA-binding IscR family transcriptional regulator